MPTKLYEAEKMIAKLRYITVLTLQGRSIADVIRWIRIAFANGKRAAHEVDYVLHSKSPYSPREMVANCSSLAGMP
jgi:hypothetical protein